MTGARAFLVGADADELLARPELLTAYLSAFTADDDVTLAIGARDVAAAAARLGAFVPDDGADVLLVPAAGVPWTLGIGAVLSSAAVEGAAAFDAREMAALRALVEGPRRRAVLVVENFHPSVGGVERLAEGLGFYLLRQGWQVDVLTRPHAQRQERVHRGIAVHELASLREPEAVARVVAATGADAVVALEAYPTAHPIVSTLMLDLPGVRRIVKPCVNEDAYRMAHERPGFLATYAERLAAVDGFVVSSYDGWDVKLAREVGVEPVYIPNAGSEVEPSQPFRELHGIAPDEPLLLVVANFWPEKNHLALLEAFRDHPGDARLALVGGDSPVWPEVGQQARAAAALDPRVLVAGEADRAGVAAAMEAADLLLLPSKAEATPLVLVEAMGRGLPWLATPTCGSARDLSGGLIVPVERMPEEAARLLAAPHERAALAEAGRAHWRSEYTWDAVGARFLALLEGRTPAADGRRAA